MNLLPDSFRPQKAPERTFAYPPAADPENAISVTLSYLSPIRMATLQDQIGARFSKDLEKPTVVPRIEHGRKIANEMIASAVVRCEGVTFRKLCALVPLDPDVVAKAGGLDEIVPMDPSGPSGHVASAWILYLVGESAAFGNWASNTSQDISKFQSEDWLDRVKNSKPGRPLNTAASQETDQATA